MKAHRKSLLKFALAAGVVLPFLCLDAAKAAAQDTFGAIARQPDTEAVGFSFNYHTRTAAETRALQECGEDGCQVMVWFRNGCGALAESPNGSAGSGVGPSRITAQSAAIKSCNGIAGGCEITRTICSDP
jgi:hypothetical protein